MAKCNCVSGEHKLGCSEINEYSYVFCRRCGKPTWMAEMSFGMCAKCNAEEPQYQAVKIIDCNQMCLLSEWDENKPRDCSICRGRTETCMIDDICEAIAKHKPFSIIDIRNAYDAISSWDIVLRGCELAEVCGVSVHSVVMNMAISHLREVGFNALKINRNTGKSEGESKIESKRDELHKRPE